MVLSLGFHVPVPTTQRCGDPKRFVPISGPIFQQQKNEINFLFRIIFLKFEDCNSGNPQCAALCNQHRHGGSLHTAYQGLT
jgi:hypothetical protein